MNFGFVAAAFLISTGRPPLDTALSHAEPPTSMRAAFTVELTDGEAFRAVNFDPRITDPAGKWRVVSSEGKSEELDRAVQEWGSEAAPDGWLFPDDLRASMGAVVEADDLGGAWKLQFQHLPSENDGPLDIWVADHLVGYAWLEPVNQNLLRVEYVAPKAFNAPGGGTVEAYEHAYVLRQDPKYGVTFVSAYMVDVQGEYLSTRISRSYRARITSVDFFFSSPVEEALFRSRQKRAGTAGAGALAQGH
jgi:hypothetical protein